MFEISNLSISIEDRFLIKNLSLTLNQNDKLAIIGEEGNGKSTLLKGILGLCEYAKVTGSINTKGNKIGYLEQSLSENNLKKTGYEFIFGNANSYNYSKKLYKYLELLNLNEKLLDQAEKILNERKLAGITTIGYLPQITISFEMMINMAVFMMVFLTKMSI